MFVINTRAFQNGMEFVVGGVLFRSPSQQIVNTGFGISHGFGAAFTAATSTKRLQSSLALAASIPIKNINLTPKMNNKINQLSPLALCIQGQRPWLPFSVFAGTRSETEGLIYETRSILKGGQALSVSVPG